MKSAPSMPGADTNGALSRGKYAPREPYPLPAQSIRPAPNPFISEADVKTAEHGLLMIALGLFVCVMFALIGIAMAAR